MAGLSGEYRCTLDDKGRLNFPSKLRDDMGETLVVARWMDNCLAVFPESEWNKNTKRFEIEEKEQSLKSAIKYSRVKRMLYGGKVDVTPDKQGRISISPEMRKYARLEKEIMVVGVGNYAEIWNTAAWRDTADNFFNEEGMAALEDLEF